MSFQTTAQAKQALGYAGQISKAFHNFANTISGVVADDKVSIGGFVQSKSAGLQNENEVIGTNGVAITGKILGVVVKDHYISSGNILTNVDKYNIGDNVAILNEGSVFIETELVANKWQYVLLNQTNGAIAFDDLNVKTGFVYTGFIVTNGNPAAGKAIIEISTAGNSTAATKTATPAAAGTTPAQPATPAKDAAATTTK